jgi:hypothetical protein
MRIIRVLALVTSLCLSLSIAPSAQAKTKINKPSSPTIVSVSSSAPKKGKVNVTVTIALPLADGGAKITGSKITAGGKSCTIRKAKTSCTIKSLKSGKTLRVIASSKNKKGFGAKSNSVGYVAGSTPYVASPNPVVSPAPPTPIRPICTIVGTSGNDTINGTNNSDIICGMGGADIIYGLGGNDTIYSGAAPGMSGLIRLVSRAQDSFSPSLLATESGDDVIYGGEGDDLIYGDAGNDLIYGGSGNDQIFGGNGNDSLLGELGADSLDGGAGANLCKYAMDDSIPVSCRSSRVDLPEFGITGVMSYVANARFDTDSAGTVYIEGTNNSSHWRQIVWSISCMAIDGEPQMGGGSYVGWIAPQQSFRVEAPDHHWTQCEQAEAERGSPIFPIFEFSVDPDNQNILDSDINVTFGTPIFVAATNDETLDRTLVPITVVNNTGRAGYLNLTSQILNSQGIVIGYGSANDYDEPIAIGETLDTFLEFSIGKPATNGAPADIGFTGATYRVSYLSITSQTPR